MEAPLVVETPSMEPAARQAALEAVTELVKLAIKSAEGGNWPGAAGHLDAAAAAYAPIPAELDGKKDPRHIGVGAAIAEGKGQVALRSGKVEEGLAHLESGVNMRLEEEASGGQPPPLSLAVGLVNLTGACHRLGRIDDAIKYNAMAIDRLRPLDVPPARLFLAAAIEARGNILSQLNRHPEALQALAESGALAAQLANMGVQGAPQLLTEIFVASSRAAFKAGNPVEAMRMSQNAADVAWERYERNPQGDREAIAHFVAAQMNLVGFAEVAGKFDKAEDALFKALRIAGPDPRIVARGKQFYEALQKLDDDKLEAGKLPRDEVEESMATLMKLAASRPPAASA